MKKIYFAQTPWSSSDDTLEDYRFQTPNNAGIWEDIVAVTNPKEAEYLIIQDETPDKQIMNAFLPENRIYISREPSSFPLFQQYSADKCKTFSYWNKSGHLHVRWWYGTNVKMSAQGYGGICKTYDELIKLEPLPKTKELCCVLTSKTFCDGHVVRKAFTKRFMNKRPLDLYGSVEFSNCKMPNNDKFETLKDYKYSLGFDNQDTIKDFFGTQLTDTLLCWAVPIFWCGTDLSRYFPEGSYIQFDARDFSEIDRIVEFLKNDDYEARIPALKKARELVLNNYNFWPTIKKAIDRE